MITHLIPKLKDIKTVQFPVSILALGEVKKKNQSNKEYHCLYQLLESARALNNKNTINLEDTKT